jgi:hypothetical protein
MVAIDMFTIATATCRLLYTLIVPMVPCWMYDKSELRWDARARWRSRPQHQKENFPPSGLRDLIYNRNPEDAARDIDGVATSGPILVLC